MKYQGTGIIEGHDNKALALANEQINILRAKTPSRLHKLFRSTIIHQTRGYYFGWVLA
jgi:hypothetical protein